MGGGNGRRYSDGWKGNLAGTTDRQSVNTAKQQKKIALSTER